MLHDPLFFPFILFIFCPLSVDPEEKNSLSYQDDKTTVNLKKPSLVLWWDYYSWCCCDILLKHRGMDLTCQPAIDSRP